jgi:hypothetical protein
MGALMDRPEPRRPWGLIIILAVALMAAIVSVPLQVLTFQQVGTASEAGVERNRRLTEQVQTLQRQQAEDVHEHRARNESAHQDQCERLRNVERLLGVPNPAPCPEDIEIEHPSLDD